MNSIASFLVFLLGAFGLQSDNACLFVVPGTSVCAVSAQQAPPPPQEESDSDDTSGCDESTRANATGNPFRPLFISNGF